MVERDWTASSITPRYLQKLMKYGFMAAAELNACWVMEDPALPVPMEGYVVSVMVFYE
jgi:hypothetical protein